MVICSYLNLSPLILIPGALTAALLGIHYPTGKAQMMKEKGIYGQALLSSLPLQGALVAIFFGVGWGASALFN